MEVGLFEKELAKCMSKFRKIISGVGPKSCDVRLSKEAIFVKFNTDYTKLEHRLLNYVWTRYDCRMDYCDRLSAELTPKVNATLRTINDELRCENITFNLHLNRNLLIVQFILNLNLESLIDAGNANIPYIQTDGAETQAS